MSHSAVLFQNGSFHVFPNETREREALAAYRGRVLYVGDREDARNAFPAGTKVEVVDLGGKMAVPGFIDSHMHLMSLGVGLRNLSLNDVSSIARLKEVVAERAKTAAPDEWILGRGWDQDFFAEKRYPTRKDLDEAGGGRPVYLTRACGHLAVASSKALELANVTRDTVDPPGGVIDRDLYGDPTGVLRESAQGLVRSKIPEDGREALLDSTKEAMRYLLERGITSVHPNDGQAGFSGTMEIYREAREAGFPLRVYWDLPYEFLDELAETPLRTGDGDDYFRIGAVKIFADGSLGGRTAALEEPYSDDPTSSGILVVTEDELRDSVYKAHALGMQVAVHAIGDRAVRVALEAIGAARGKIPRERPRHRVVHAQILSPGLISDIKRNGVIADVQPKFLTTDMRWAQERVGLQRMRSSYAWRTMLKAGLHMAGGSDCPVEPADPLWGIYAAVTRKDMEGEPKTSFYPNERITVEEALRLFTLGGAYAEFAEHRKGTLEPGKLADFTVLSENLFRVPHDSIKDIQVEMTVVGGQVAYAR
ncbi:MAG: amidohydrolase [Bacillota bacterium]|jgi:predicted amidohydrolase YtcJ|nr:amidohydrolase [Candidatus Fermentithermobacillaceae bacterium]